MSDMERTSSVGDVGSLAWRVLAMCVLVFIGCIAALYQLNLHWRKIQEDD